MRKVINYLHCEWELFCFVDSTESMVNSHDYTKNKINQIKLKYGIK